MITTTILLVLLVSARAAADAPGFVNALERPALASFGGPAAGNADAGAGVDGNGETLLNTLAQQQQQQQQQHLPPAPPLVDFGPPPSTAVPAAARNLTATTATATTATIDDETLALLSAFSAGEQRVVREVSGAASFESNNDGKGAQGAEARLGALLAALKRTRDGVERELASTLDERVFGGLSALRRRLGPRASLRLIEEARKARGTKCKDGSFTPPKPQAARIVGPGAFLAVTGPQCSLRREAAPLQLTFPVECTGGGVQFRETPPLFSAATLEGAKATTRECKAERKWGPEGTAEVVLFDPKNLARQFGLLPASAFKASGGGGGGGGGGPEGKAAWRAGAADVKEAIEGLWGAMLGNLTVKDQPNGAWKNVSARGVVGQAEAVAAKYEALRAAVGATPPTKVEAADNGGGGGGDGEDGIGSDGGGGGGGGWGIDGGKSVTKSDGKGAGPSAARREAEARLRSLAGEYLQERLAALLLGGQGGEGEAGAGAGEEGGGGGESGDGDDGDDDGRVPGIPSGGGSASAEGLLAAMRDLAREAVAEAAPPGLLQQ